MASVQELICDAIAAELNVQPLTDYGVDFTAERNYAEWTLPLSPEDGDELRVDVVPESYPVFELATRGNGISTGQIRRHVKARVVMRQRLVPREADSDGAGRYNTDVDLLANALEAMAEDLTEAELTTLDTATWIDTDIVNIAVGSHLTEHQQYTGIFDLVFELVR